MSLSPLAGLFLFFLVSGWLKNQRALLVAEIRGETPPSAPPKPLHRWVVKGLDWLLPPSRLAFDPPMRLSAKGLTPYEAYRCAYQSRDTEGLRWPLLPWEPLTEAGKAYRERQLAYRREHGYRLDR